MKNTFHLFHETKKLYVAGYRQDFMESMQQLKDVSYKHYE